MFISAVCREQENCLGVSFYGPGVRVSVESGLFFLQGHFDVSRIHLVGDLSLRVEVGSNARGLSSLDGRHRWTSKRQQVDRTTVIKCEFMQLHFIKPTKRTFNLKNSPLPLSQETRGQTWGRI